MGRTLAPAIVAIGLALAVFPASPDAFTFAIIGDRTGLAEPGVYQRVWREIDGFKLGFAINVGDSIEGGRDATAASEWREIAPLLKRKLPFYPVPGNHDIWSPASEKLWRSVTGRAPYYSFNFSGVHITVLDNSRGQEIPPEQMAFLEKDLAAHLSARHRLIFFHKPSWLTPVLFRNPNFELHRLAKKYKVSAIVSGHVHRFARWNFEGVEYLMVGSSGGQLRGGTFADGWFFHWIEARVADSGIEFIVHELPAPDGRGRVFKASEWTTRPLN